MRDRGQSGSDDSARSGARSNWRTPEIEEYSNLHLIHPASAALTGLFARWGWSPNAVSLLGMASALAASWCFYHYRSPAMPVIGLLFMVGWHVLDGADGQLARLTGKTTDAGKVIDGLCDHLGFGMVYVALALSLQQEMGPWVWLLAAAAGASHVLQAGALEFHRDSYDCWVHGKTGKCPQHPQPAERRSREKGLLARPLRAVHAAYVRLQFLISEVDERIVTVGQHLERDPARRELAREYRDASLGTVRLWTWLSANKRTLAVTLCCAVQLPILFFLYEILVLNAVLFWLRSVQRRTNSRLREALSACGDSGAAAAPR